MVTGGDDDDDGINGDGAMGNEVDDNGDGAMGNEVDYDGDGVTGDNNDDDGDDNGAWAAARQDMTMRNERVTTQ